MINIEDITKGPKALYYCYWIRKILIDLGGSGTSSEIIDKIVDSLDLNDEELTKEHPSGSNVLKTQISLAKHYMTKTGYIDSSVRGIWNLTKLGYDTTFDNISDVNLVLTKYDDFNRTERVNIAESRQKQIVIEKKELEKKNTLQDKLINILQNINPFGFERLIQRLLREAGFTKVEVTQKTNDGGIDGFGYLPLNHFVSIKIMFQCKRFKGLVSSPMIRDFRGSITGRADKGLFITTGTFSREALIEANRDGATHIELIDGDKLYEIFYDTGLAFTIDKTEINEDFFDEYK